MKILVVSQYFYPENFRINDLVKSLKDRGHEISVLTAKPNYPKGDYFNGYSWSKKNIDYFNDVKVYRSNIFLRKNGGSLRLILNYLSFVFSGTIKLFSIKEKFDKIFIFAPSPITVGIIGIFAAKKFKAKSYLWIHDLWPESVSATVGVNNFIIIQTIDFFTRLIYKFSDFLLVQSPEFKFYLNKQKVDLNKVTYYPYYAESFYKPKKRKEKLLKTFSRDFNIVFAGNIGVAQSFETIIESAEILKNKNQNVKFIIFGDGRDKNRIQSIIKEKKLESYFDFKGVVAPEKMSNQFACADSLLITLKKADIFSYTIPGKLQSYLACGKPILGAVDGISKKIINESKSGLCAGSEDSEQLSQYIIEMKNSNKKTLDTFSSNARNYFEKEFEKEKLLKRLEEILN
jgi:glycosyltransferase involved in cell wall biosynthesis